MHIIPVTILDNFFDDPDSIRKWALQQEYFPAEDGQWPGVRTKPLYEIHPHLNEILCHRYFNLFFDLRRDLVDWVVDARFQITNKSHGKGWIHSDNNYRLSAIIYLTPDADPSSGTSIYARKSGVVYPPAMSLNDTKINLYKGNISLEEAEPDRQALQDGFVETIRVNNVYNRMLTFDSHLKHAANEYVGEDETTDRLTLIMFAVSLRADHTPLSRYKIIG